MCGDCFIPPPPEILRMAGMAAEAMVTSDQTSIIRRDDDLTRGFMSSEATTTMSGDIKCAEYMNCCCISFIRCFLSPAAGSHYEDLLIHHAATVDALFAGPTDPSLLSTGAAALQGQDIRQDFAAATADEGLEGRRQIIVEDGVSLSLSSSSAHSMLSNHDDDDHYDEQIIQVHDL
jgi:hypothetical protein